MLVAKNVVDLLIICEDLFVKSLLSALDSTFKLWTVVIGPG